MISSYDEDDWVFCDGRTMRRSEMRRLVAEDMARFARMDAERNKRMEQENEALRKELEALQRERNKTQWWAQWRQQFERWQRKNQDPAEAYTEERARERRQRDESMVDALLARIEEKESAHRVAGFNHNERLINGLTDHEYIEWMFACHEHRLVCPG